MYNMETVSQATVEFINTGNLLYQKTASSTNKNTFVPDQLGNRSRIKMLHAVLNFLAIIFILVGPLLVTNF